MRPLTALLQCGQEPSDRRDGRFSATQRERKAGPIARVRIVSNIPYPLNEHVVLPPSESVCVPTERGTGVGSSPRPVDYCSTCVGVRTKNGAHAPTSCALYRATMNDPSSNAIHSSAWKWNSTNFALTAFSEVRDKIPTAPQPNAP